MSKNYYLLLFCATTTFVQAQNITFADSYFKNKLLEADTWNEIAKNTQGNYGKIDTNNDGEIQESEAAQIAELNVSSSSIAYFDGVVYFTNLNTLDCTNNGRTGTPLGSGNPISLDISGMPNLKHLRSENNKHSLGFGSFSNLEELDLFKNRGFLGVLDLTEFTSLKNLNLGKMLLSGLNIDGLTAIEHLDVSYTNVQQLNVSALANLKYLNTSWSELLALDVSNLSQLEELRCQFGALQSLNISGCTNLKKVNTMSTYVTNLDASNLPQLEDLDVGASELAMLNITGSNNLQSLKCDYTQLAQLDASNLHNLTYLSCAGGLITDLNISGSHEIEHLDVSNNKLTALDCREMSHLNYLDCLYNPLETLYIRNGVVEEFLAITQDVTLTYVCADEEQLANVQIMITDGGNPDCVVDATCELLQTNTFATTETIAVYPNPANDVLNLETNPMIQISSIDIYNVLGQLVVTSGAQKTIDVSRLQDGNYFLKISSNSGTIVKRFVKN